LHLLARGRDDSFVETRRDNGGGIKPVLRFFAGGKNTLLSGVISLKCDSDNKGVKDMKRPKIMKLGFLGSLGRALDIGATRTPITFRSIKSEHFKSVMQALRSDWNSIGMDFARAREKLHDPIVVNLVGNKRCWPSESENSENHLLPDAQRFPDKKVIRRSTCTVRGKHFEVTVLATAEGREKGIVVKAKGHHQSKNIFNKVKR
jgi:hypothetical protein